ncbi:DUF397 domain-containing protein [Actinoalloteichus caeruleus]|uniref:DUF397 domain-containing protein n=1 Tax=Actinoalloteichus cyanogriseus TaxID=2893586 RepID=UPI000552F90E
MAVLSAATTRPLSATAEQTSRTTDGHHWRKSSRSTNKSACVEIATDPRGAAIRDSKNPSGGILTLTATQYGQFLAAVKADHALR